MPGQWRVPRLLPRARAAGPRPFGRAADAAGLRAQALASIAEMTSLTSLSLCDCSALTNNGMLVRAPRPRSPNCRWVAPGARAAARPFALRQTCLLTSPPSCRSSLALAAGRAVRQCATQLQGWTLAAALPPWG